MNITDRQPRNVVRAPPATAPAANPPERTATRYPSALFLSGPSGKILMKIAKAVTVDRKSTRLNSSHSQISYAVFCLKKKKKNKKYINSLADHNRPKLSTCA